jgi:hypothetical protein
MHARESFAEQPIPCTMSQIQEQTTLSLHFIIITLASTNAISICAAH